MNSIEWIEKCNLFHIIIFFCAHFIYKKNFFIENYMNFHSRQFTWLFIFIAFDVQPQCSEWNELIKIDEMGEKMYGKNRLKMMLCCCCWIIFVFVVVVVKADLLNGFVIPSSIGELTYIGYDLSLLITLNLFST